MRTVADWLSNLGLGKYAEIFVQNDIDWRALPHLEAVDLQELGVSLGHRKIILAALTELDITEPAGHKVKQADAPSAEKHESTPDIRLLSVLFCDMVGSSALSSRFPPEEMHDLISTYQDVVANAVKSFEGYVAKFLGDGVLAYFGWPVALEDHAERAVHAGFAAISAVEQLRDPAGGPIKSRIGISTGRVVVGDLAGGSVLDRGQIAGETPNLAARFQVAAQPGQILVGESTRRLAQSAFEFKSLGQQRLKGFQDEVPVFLAIGAREVENRFDAAHGDGLSPFVGRKSELGILLEGWEFAKSGQGQIAVLTGEAGIGKSRLLETLIDHVGREESELIRLQCSPYHSTSSLYPVIQRLNRVAGFTQDDDAETRTAKLDQMISLYGEDAASVRPIYADLLSLDLHDRMTPVALSAQQRKEITVNALVNRPLMASRRAPVLLVVEDAHWIDPSTNELLKEVASRIHSARIYVVVSHRPGWTAQWSPAQSNVTTVTMGRLTKPQMRALIESMLSPLSDKLLDRIAERTDGVPLFVEELTRSIRDSGKDPTENVDIPDSLQGSLMARLDLLPSSCKEVAQIAAVIGREFDRGLLAEVASLDERSLDDALGHLLATQLIVLVGASNNTFSFRHALIQDTAYQSLLGRTRRQYHEAIAEAIVRTQPALATTQPELVAWHYSEAQRSDHALSYWTKAGERALERSANFEAVDHFSNAMAIVEQLPVDRENLRRLLVVRLNFAEALRHAGRLVAAIANFSLAAEQARRDGETDAFVRATLGLASTQWLAGLHPQSSVLLLVEAMSMLGPDEDTRRCLVMTQLARIHMLLGDQRTGETFHDAAMDLARKVNDRSSMLELLNNKFLVPRQLVSAEDAALWLDELDNLINLAEAVGSDDARMHALTMNIYVGAELGRRERINRSVATLKEFGETRQRLHDQWIARHGAAMLAILDGDLPAAEVLAGEGLAMGRQTHGDQVEGIYGIQMFTIRREQDRLAEVAPVMKRFLDENTDETVWLPGFALVAAELGYTDAARQRLLSLADGGFEMSFDAKRSTSLSYVAEVAYILEEADVAPQLYDLMSIYRHMSITTGTVTICLGAASRYLGMLASTMGDFDTAEGHYEHALAMNSAMDASLWLGHTKADYALLLRRRGTQGALERSERLWGEAWATAHALDLGRLKRRLRPNIQ
ncbi:MAG: adenylate/guanylate cyclase with repeat [Rhizobium sp.]|nr:adenylate/guanylate cyclase with repeat [Rhizobium sp.]